VAFPDGFRDDLRNAVDGLGPLQGACLVLRAVHGHSYDEIASMLDIPAATARSHVFRARAALASMLDRKEGGSDV
jgi:RNA polymerase sigma-70 factor (ECF subfamily)